MNNKLVSVIIPVYNAEKYVAEAIQSVIDQTWEYKEIIIVDDCSTDNSLNVVNQFECDWIKVYKLAQNKGQSFASNFGYIQATGSYIKFLDADDIIDTDYLSIMMNSVVSDDDLYFSDCVNFYGDLKDQNHQPYNTPALEKMAPVDFLINSISNMRQGGRWLIPRRIIEKAGLWNESISFMNDFEYFNRLCINCNYVHIVNNAKVYYRQLANSLSDSRQTKSLEFAYRSISLAGEQLLEKENSKRVRLYIANSLQGYIYLIYPHHPRLIKQIEKHIKEVGGSDLKIDGGKKMMMVTNLIGWKAARALRYYLNMLKIKVNN
ncbi:MAG: glycosyltransferase family 2 protein [Bacteroidota bacterium]